MAPKHDPVMLRFLTRHFNERYSINQLAKQIGMTPKGAHKLLRRLEQEGVVRPEKLGNAIFYALNFGSDMARKKAELSLFEGIRLPYARAQAKDMERLRPFASMAVLFGSVLEKGDKAGDIDVLVVVEKEKYKAFRQALSKLQSIKPKHIQAILQTSKELANSLKKPDPVVMNALKTGKFLWGQEIILDAIRKVVEQ